MPKLHIVDKKLGRSKAWGLCYQGDNLIEIDPRQKSKDYFNTLVHELLHEAFHEMSETQVTRAANLITNNLWLKGYRKVDLR